jgi:hypothetical protein
MRIPISRVRRETAYATSANTPVAENHRNQAESTEHRNGRANRKERERELILESSGVEQSQRRIQVEHGVANRAQALAQRE